LTKSGCQSKKNKNSLVKCSLKEAALKKMKALAQVVVCSCQHGCTKLTALSRLHCCNNEVNNSGVFGNGISPSQRVRCLEN
jgi:hypothetical protein